MKKEQVFVRPPFPGAVVRDPATGNALPAGGGWVESTPHWRRQIAMGEVIKSEPPRIPNKKTEPAQAAGGDTA